jgi:hypothetical protein
MAVNEFGAIRRLTARFKGRSRVHADWAAHSRFLCCDQSRRSFLHNSGWRNAVQAQRWFK